MGAAAPEVKLVTATLRVLGDPADALDLHSDAGNILRMVVPTGAKAWVWGMMGERYMVQVPEVGGSGTVEMAYVELAEEDQQRMDAVIPEAYNQQNDEQRMAYAAMEAYYNETAACGLLQSERSGENLPGVGRLAAAGGGHDAGGGSRTSASAVSGAMEP